VQADARQRPPVGHHRWKLDAQSTSTRVEPTIITSSPIVLITRGVVGQRHLDVLDEALDRVDRLLLALLLGQRV
jgi:hypothetical protein